jgi:hypothetical protein
VAAYLVGSDLGSVALRCFTSAGVVLAVRAAPVVVHAVRSPRLPPRIRWSTSAIFVLFVLATILADRDVVPKQLVVGAAAYAALVPIATSIHLLATSFARRQIGHVAMAALVAALCFGLPLALSPEAAVPLVVVLAWELALSAYSYCVDNRRAAERPSLRECVFFLLVNPTIVFEERGSPSASGPRLSGLRRCALGLVIWVGIAFLQELFGEKSLLGVPLRGGPVSFGSTYSGFVITSALFFLAVYSQHSGLAHFQIGLMRTIGVDVPERYDRPFLAVSPVDFWRRWNVWLGSWIRRYVFYPSGLSLRRGRFSPRITTAAAALVAFMVAGALHDVAWLGSELRQTSGEGLGRGTGTFAAFGIILVVWTGLAQLGQRTWPSVPAVLRAAVGWCLFFHATFAVMALRSVVSWPSVSELTLPLSRLWTLG